MALKGFANQRLAYAGVKVEAVAGTLETGSNYDRLAATSISLDAQSEAVSVFEIGAGEPRSKRTTSDHVTGTITYPFRFADLDAQVAFGLRDAAMPAEVAVSKTVSIIASGTHLDGTTGPQLKVLAALGDLDALKAASSSADLDGLLMWIVGSAADDWDDIGPKMCKSGSPYDSGADTVVDFYDEFFQASAGFGAAFTGEVGVAVTLDVGAALKNQAVVAAGNVTYSIIGYYADVAKWVYLTGVTFGPPSFAWSDRGICTVTQTFLGDLYGALTNVNPNAGFSIVDSLTYNPPIMGGPDMDDIYLGTATQGLHLDDCSITSLAFNNSGDWSPINNTLGGTGLCGRIGNAMDFDATFDYQVDDTANATAVDRAIQLIGARATREKTILIAHMHDNDGNTLALSHMQGEPMPSVVGSVGADSDGPASGTYSQGSHARNGTSRTFVYQRRSGGELEV